VYWLKDLDSDLVPWQCSCRGTQRQLGYGSSPGVSVLGKMNRVVYSQAHVSTAAYAIFSLVALILTGRVHTLPMPALDSDLVPFYDKFPHELRPLSAPPLTCHIPGDWSAGSVRKSQWDANNKHNMVIGSMLFQLLLCTAILTIQNIYNISGLQSATVIHD